MCPILGTEDSDTQTNKNPFFLVEGKYIDPGFCYGGKIKTEQKKDKASARRGVTVALKIDT